MRKILRFSSLIILFMLTLEVAARIDDFAKYRAPLFSPYTSSRLRMSDEDGMRCNVPGARFEKYQNNSAGFRGPEIQTTKPKDTKRLVCLGASETYGLYEKEFGEWPALLQELLLSNPRTEIINASVVGLGLPDFESYLDKYVMKFDPDMIILMVSPQYFSSALVRSIIEERVSPEEVAALPQPTHAGFKFKSRVLSKAKLTIKAFLPDRIMDPINLRRAEAKLLAAETRRLKGTAPLDEIPSSIVNEYTAALRELVASLQARGIEVILASYPTLLDESNIDQFPYLLAESRRFFVYLSPMGMVDVSLKFSEATELLAEEMKTAFVDLNGRVPHTDEYFADNVHYTDKGAKLVAELFADCIQSGNQEPN